ncbi:hypothetical protein O0235_07780 [Tepidiforma flava]|uniref:Uncharacterized protein n=1 Tax=Tepidiforma flava TaxID=3004094 RepID=A0ABY7MBW8_9CHLR|nr:hypothetical protein [Tepidiforma flava]WBL37465.1 hypothetical protein O0235_07780 [Tepidiforma flava]
MRDAVLAAAAWIAGIAHILGGCLMVIIWLGGLGWFVLSGAVLYAMAWVILGPLLAYAAGFLLRVPFVLLGLLLAALAGRREEYLAFLARISDR